MSKPLNQHNLWHGKIQQANYPKPITKPDMKLLPLTYHDGQGFIEGAEYEKIKNEYCDLDLSCKLFEKTSEAYWAAVEERKRHYRLRLSDTQ
jgi:hypothetical protein